MAPSRLGAGQTDQLPLEEAELHYLRRVLRLRPGDGFDLVDGAGRLWNASLTAAGDAQLDQPLGSPLQQETPAERQLELAVAWPKRDGEVLLRMVCELGVDRITPLLAERSVVPEPRSRQRQETILREAAEQCERLWLPGLGCQQQALDFFQAPRKGLALFATTRSDGLPLLAGCLAQLAEPLDQWAPSVVVAVGPEGGWTAAEEDCAMGHGWQAVSLGPTILRTSTAAVAAVAQMVAWRAGCQAR